MNTQTETPVAPIVADAETQQKIEVLKTESADIIVKAEYLASNITDDASCAEADELYNRAGKLLKKIDADLDSMKTSLWSAWKNFCDYRESLKKKPELVQKALKDAIVTYKTEQDRKRQEEEERLRKENQKALEDQQLAEAQALVNSGDKEAAAQVLETQVVAAPVKVAKSPELAQTALRGKWKAEVVNLKELCRAIADGRAPANLVLADQSALNKMAAALKQNLSIPGVKAYEEKTLAGRYK